VALEAEVGDLRKPLEEATTPLKEIAKDFKGMAKESGSMLEWSGPVHDSGPTPDDARTDFESLPPDSEPESDSEAEDA